MNGNQVPKSVEITQEAIDTGAEVRQSRQQEEQQQRWQQQWQQEEQQQQQPNVATRFKKLQAQGSSSIPWCGWRSLQA
jgi:hypothetical protein